MSATPLAIPVVCEATPEDLGILRSLLDLSLQPLERFDGFDHRDQVSLGAYRYQLNFISYALAMAQLTRTPAFTGYLAEAQRNLIRKMCDRRVWSYWATQSLIGYLRRETDPIKHANVMYSGYFGVMLGMYQALNRDTTFNEPGSLSLRWSEQLLHEYDFRRMALAIRDNMLANPNCPQYPCEPHLIYPICNTFAVNTLVMHDRLHGDNIAGDLVERVGASYRNDGWLRTSGRFVTIRLGANITVGPPVLGADAAMACWLSAAMPDIAERTWTAICDRFIDFDGESISLRGKRWMRFDAGNNSYKHGETNTRVAIMNAANELGAVEIAHALQRSLDDNLDIDRANGARRYRGVSNLVNAMYAVARFSRTHGLRDLINVNMPRQWRTGPILAEAAYPDVLVAKAITDGQGLELVLRPGNGPRRVRVGIHHLRPGAAYRVNGGIEDTVVADGTGRGYFHVDLTTRIPVSLTPTNA